MAPEILIVGAGGFGMSTADAILAAGQFTVAGFVDDRGPELGPVLGFRVLGRSSELRRLREHYQLLVVAIGDNRRRQAICEQALALGYELGTVVHPSATLSLHAHLADGVLVMAGATVGTLARLGRGVIVNAGAVVDHHALVDDFAHLGAGACMAGGSRLGPGAKLAEGAVLRAGQVLAGYGS